MGGLLRCDECGSVSWDVLGLTSKKAAVCANCGTELKPERRRPGKRRFSAAAERRDVVSPSRRAPA